jgi:dihydrofolate reductase
VLLPAIASPVRIVAHLLAVETPAEGANWAAGKAHFLDVAVSTQALDTTEERSTDMGKIVISENVTLDGVIQDPTGDDGFARGGWFSRIADHDHQAWAEVETREAMAAEALLMGRRTYEYLVARWPGRTGAWADRLNSMPKYVVASTLVDPAWDNSMVLTGDPVKEANKLKDRLDGEIVVNGSGHLAHTLIENDLVDELRLIVYPSLIGAGMRLFPGTSDQMPFRLVGNETVGTGLALLKYRRVRAT